MHVQPGGALRFTQPKAVSWGFADNSSCCAQVYVPEAMEPLLKCMHTVSSPSSMVLLAHYKRFAEASERFWHVLPKYFSHEKISEASYGVKDQPDNIGLFVLKKL